MRRASGKWKREKARGVGGVWPLAFLLISSSYFHSFGSSPPHFSLSHSHTCPPCAMFPDYVYFLQCKTLPGCWHWKLHKIFYCNYCPCHQRNLCKKLHGTELQCHLARCSINKNPHGQTRLIKGSVSCAKCVVRSCLVNSSLGKKASVFFPYILGVFHIIALLVILSSCAFASFSRTARQVKEGNSWCCIKYLLACMRPHILLFITSLHFWESTFFHKKNSCCLLYLLYLVGVPNFNHCTSRLQACSFMQYQYIFLKKNLINIAFMQ